MCIRDSTTAGRTSVIELPAVYDFTNPRSAISTFFLLDGGVLDLATDYEVDQIVGSKMGYAHLPVAQCTVPVFRVRGLLKKLTSWPYKSAVEDAVGKVSQLERL